MKLTAHDIQRRNAQRLAELLRLKDGSRWRECTWRPCQCATCRKQRFTESVIRDYMLGKFQLRPKARKKS